MINEPKGAHMGLATHHSAAVRVASANTSPPALELQTRPALDTATAAYYLNRRPQSMRIWACRDCGPLRPLRINGRLAWKTEDIRRLLGVAP